MIEDDRRTPTLDAIDDPHGIPHMVFEEDVDADEAAAQFVRQVQAIRWDLWNLLGSLDNVDQPAGATQWAMLQALDHLGIAVRAEAAHLDGVDPDAADLFTEGSMRRLHSAKDADGQARKRRRQIDAVPDPNDPDDQP